MIIFKWVLRETGYGLHSTGSGFIENREFLDQMFINISRKTMHHTVRQFSSFKYFRSSVYGDQIFPSNPFIYMDCFHKKINS